MSRLLADILGAREPVFTQHINRLEQACGQPSIDLRLSSDISKLVRQKLKELGLDPADTTGKELYFSLQALVKKHDEYLAKSLGAKNASRTTEVINAVVAAVPKLKIPQTCWAIKHSTAKRLLSQSPPKHVMKQLRYRSVDSLLKRANIDEVFAAIYFAESPSWQERFVAAYKKLEPSDFETRQISVIALDGKRWGDSATKFISQNHHNIIRVNEMGVVAILPMSVENMPGLAITLLPLIIYHLNKIRSISSYLKLNQVKPTFNSHFAKAVSGSLRNVASLQGRPLAWETIHKHFGRSSGRSAPEVFAPHIQSEDLLWQQAEDVLYKLEPALKFWEGLDYVAAPLAKLPVSLSLLDNAVSYCNQLEYGQQSVQFFREALRRELYMRYLEQQPIEDHVTSQFDEDNLEIEVFAVVERGWR
ncbi:MAG: hypothetical protein ACXWLH_04735 [Candidatus Saccharimonadales bacterium]